MDRLIALRKAQKKTQADIANLLGISRQAYSNYELGLREPDIATLKFLSALYDVPVDFLVSNEVEWVESEYDDFKKIKNDSEKYHFFKLYGVPTALKDQYFRVKAAIEHPESVVTKTKGIKIPVVGVVPAGIPIEAIEEIIDHEEITEEMARNGKHIGLRIKGDSMMPTICDGDTVIVRLQPDVENGDTAIVMVNGDDATCKRVVKHKTGITLVPNNPVYEPQYFDAKQINSTPVRIIGKVVELRRKF